MFSIPQASTFRHTRPRCFAAFVQAIRDRQTSLERRVALLDNVVIVITPSTSRAISAQSRTSTTLRWSTTIGRLTELQKDHGEIIGCQALKFRLTPEFFKHIAFLLVLEDKRGAHSDCIKYNKMPGNKGCGLSLQALLFVGWGRK